MVGIVESIPNFSEGCDPGVIETLKNTLVSVQGVACLTSTGTWTTTDAS